MNNKEHAKQAPEISIASDYAVLRCPNGMKFYYGYEVTSPENPKENEELEWCFEFRYQKIKTKIPFSELGVKDQFDVTECLLAGIAEWISRFNTKI